VQVFDERKALVGKWVSFLFGKTQHAAENFVFVIIITFLFVWMTVVTM